MAVADKPLLSVLSGGKAEKTPIWLMRQAGRYLPEYRALRAEKGGFLDLVQDPRRRGRGDAPADPPLRLRRRDPVLGHPDRAVRAGPGPALRGGRRAAPVARLWSTRRWPRSSSAPERLEPVYATVEKVAAELCRKPRLSWALPAAPGRSRPIWWRARAAATRPRRGGSPIAIPAAFQAIVDAIVGADRRLSLPPDRSGVEAVQLFDSWAGSLSPGAVRALGDRSDRARSSPRFKARHPDVPVIGFPKGAGGKLAAYARETGVDAIGLDETVDPAWAACRAAAGHAGPGQSRPARADRRRRGA